MAGIGLLSLKQVLKVEVPVPERGWFLQEELQCEDLTWVFNSIVSLGPEAASTAECGNTTRR